MKEKAITYLSKEIGFIAITKPAGLLSIPDRYNQALPSAYEICKAQHQELYIVHRLDKDTSGILLFATDREAHQKLNMLFEKQLVNKTYWAITEGVPTPDEFTLDLPIAHDPSSPGRMIVHPKGKPSCTQYRILKKFKQFALLELCPKSGRTHQLRVHMAAIGHPLVADPLYGIRKSIGIQDIKKRVRSIDSDQPSYLLQRTALHAKSLSFVLGHHEFNLEAPLPKDFAALLSQLEKWNSPA